MERTSTRSPPTFLMMSARIAMVVATFTLGVGVGVGVLVGVGIGALVGVGVGVGFSATGYMPIATSASAASDRAREIFLIAVFKCGIPPKL